MFLYTEEITTKIKEHDGYARPESNAITGIFTFRKDAEKFREWCQTAREVKKVGKVYEGDVAYHSGNQIWFKVRIIPKHATRKKFVDIVEKAARLLDTSHHAFRPAHCEECELYFALESIGMEPKP